MGKRSLKNLVIDPLAQMKFVAEVLMILIISNSVLLMFTFIYFTNFAAEFASQDYPEAVLILFNQKIYQYSVLLVLLFLGLSGAAIALVIYRSHAVVGPVYAMEKFIRQRLMNEDYSTELTLRKGDHFENLQNALNDLQDHLKSAKK